MEKYSQNNEEKEITEYFGKLGITGRFLDIGAFDGKTFSNTYRLALLGWSGVCIEPSPSVFPTLEKLYKDNENVATLKVALGDVDGMIKFYDSNGDAVSSTVKGNCEKYKVTPTEIEVMMVTPETLFDEIGYEYDFINIDTEQTNLQILVSLPFENLTKLGMICVEHDGNPEIIKSFLEPYGFIEWHRNAENIILSRN